MVKRPRSSNTQPVNSSANIESTVSVRSGVHDDPTDTMTALRDVGDRFTKTANCPEEFFHANEAMYQIFHKPYKYLQVGGQGERIVRIATIQPVDGRWEMATLRDRVWEELTSVLRQMFTIARQNEAQKKPFGPLDQLHVQGIDCESIWAELELRNAPLERHIRKALTRLNQSEDISLAADITSDEEEIDEIDALEDEDKDDQDEDQGQDQDQDRRYSGSESESESDAMMKMKMTEEGQEEDKEEEEEDEDSDQEEEEEESKKETDTFFDLEDMEKFADKEDSAEDDLDDTVRNEMYGGENDSDSEFGDSGDEDDNPQDDDQDGDETDADSDSEGESRDGRTSSKVAKLAKNQKAEDSEDSQDLGGGVKHSDFFRQSTGQRPRGLDDDEEEQNEDDGKMLTAHGEHSRRMKGSISFNEHELLAEKPWALRGEIKSQDRPQNSLLEATVDVERATRAPPPPTPELSMTLLDMIKERCLKENWDDVTPREVEGPAVRKEAPHVSQEKSKQGLADLYENEFLKKTMGVKEDDPQKDLKDDLKQLFKKLSGKLDALCNFHYTPKAIIPEIKVQADVAAIAMEEVLPSSVADAEALAPEEVYDKKRGRNAEFLGGHEEMSQDERKRTRLSKKAKRRKDRRKAEAAQKLVSKINPGLGNKYEKAKMLKEIEGAKNVELAPVTGDAGKEFSTSSKFFAKLQESVRTSVNAAGKDSEGGQEQLSSKGNQRSAQLRL